MVAQIEVAPENVGFVYPNPQHFGNRNDYVQVPEYKLHLLLADTLWIAFVLSGASALAAPVSAPEPTDPLAARTSLRAG